MAEIVAISPEVKQDIAWSRGSIMCCVNCLKFLQPIRKGSAGQTRPHGGSDANYGIKLTLVIAEVHGLEEPGEPREHVTGGLLTAVLDL